MSELSTVAVAYTDDDIRALYSISIELVTPEIAGRLEDMIRRFLRDPQDKIDPDIAAAFVLGVFTAEKYGADPLDQGLRLIAGRRTGQPLASKARREQGDRRRRAIVNAASELYKQDIDLRHNDWRTADLIVQRKLSALKKRRDSTYLGHDAIIKYLRDAKRAGSL